MYQFNPDHRNIGGRSLIITQAHNHRIGLQQIKERQLQDGEYRPSNRKPLQSIEQSDHAYNLIKHRRKINDIQTQPLTDRQQSLFFRRVESPSEQGYQSLLHQRPLSYKKLFQNKNVLQILEQTHRSIKLNKNQFSFRKTLREKQISVIPDYTHHVNWPALIQELEYNQTINEKFLKDLSIRYQIYADTDFAILIRMLLQTFDNIKQEDLVDIFAQIIEDLEN